MSVQGALPSALFDLKPRRFIVALFAIGALLLCAFLMHAFEHGQNHETTPTAASLVHVAAAAGNQSSPVSAGHGTQSSVAQSGGVADHATRVAQAVADTTRYSSPACSHF